MHYNKGGDLFTYISDPSVFEVKNGFIEALTKPGIGIEVNEALVRETSATYMQEKAWRNIVWRGEDGCLREW